jgi:energy-coupling factor transporter ATP-binding protein EcfA2
VAFGCTVRDDSLVRTLENLKGRQYLKHDDKKTIGKKLYKENVEIISSDKAGVGKSTQIKLKIKSQNKKYIHFPFGGEFSRKDVINRLKKVQDKITNEDNTVIHLDLYDSKQTDLMKDFLYSFLVTKLYGQSENLFYLSKKVKIVIEIPCGFVDFFNKYPLLSMFENRTEMKIADLPPLIVPKVINSNVQIVCNYLKLLNSGKLSETDLIINGVSLLKDDIKSMINEDVFNGDTTKDAELLDQKECDALIKDLLKNKLKIKYPTYYQINSFINVFSGQLKNFSMNFGLSAANLIQSGIQLGNQNFKSLRDTMFNSFLKNTIHFTQGAFDKILTAQQETYNIKVMQGNYDENLQEEAAIKALSEPGDIISCNKIDPSLVFFHEGGGQEFSIITKDNPNKDEYNKLLQLRKSFVILQNENYKSYGKNDQLEEVPKELKRYTKFTHTQFLEEIRSILSVRNPVFTKDKAIYKEKDKAKIDPDTLKLKSIEEIVGEYVFTADNFIKMVLILLRIRENIPVIMMGETGCGKTSLIRKLSELINNGDSKMEILNIHAGITDEEIVKFLFEEKEIDGVKYDSIIEKARKLEIEEEKIFQLYKKREQKYFKKKLWVFLDEINTCNCMGLICEMMTKHTCQGVELPENIFFIGACNPYRYGKKAVDDYALKIEGVKERNLVYTVNPLPFSLLNFVFNFGNLTPKDEESYINNMVVRPIENFFWKDIEQKNKDKKDFERKI